MSKQAFLRQRDSYPSLSPSLPLTPASIMWGEKKLLNFSSRDYLGLSQHAETRKNAMRYLLHYGTGICDPERKTGYLECQRLVEEKCAEAFGLSLAHLFPSHTSALGFILEQFSEKQNALFIDGTSEELHFKGQTCAYKDLQGLEMLLRNSSASCRLIVSESLSGRTGNIVDLDGLISLAQEYDAFLLVDDSHAFGVKGKNGYGLAQGRQGIDFVLCSFDCAAGASGACIACPEAIAPFFLKDLPSSRQNAIAFSALGAIEAAIDLIPNLEGERMQLEQRIHWLSQHLKIPASSHLIAIPCESEEEAQRRMQALLSQEILCEVRASHLLCAINAHHTPEELMQLIKALEYSKEPFVLN